MPECDDSTDEIEVAENFTDFEDDINPKNDTELEKAPSAEYLHVFNDDYDEEIEQSSNLVPAK